MTALSIAKTLELSLTPASAELLRALLRDPLVVEVLRALRTTEYHWVAEREGKEPITGGHHATWEHMVHECEWVLSNDVMASPRGPTRPFDGVRRVTIFDALGQAVWSKEAPSGN